MSSNSFTRKRPLNRRPHVCTTKKPSTTLHCEIEVRPDLITIGSSTTAFYAANDPAFPPDYHFDFQLLVTDGVVSPDAGTLPNGGIAQSSTWQPITPGTHTITIEVRDQLGNLVCTDDADLQVDPF
jgi:hypothetical protein